jgi:hypothetical protein
MVGRLYAVNYGALLLIVYITFTGMCNINSQISLLKLVDFERGVLINSIDIIAVFKLS